MSLDTAWPQMPGALVVARFARVHGDGSDADDRPDWIAPVGAELTFTPSITGPLVYDPTGAKIIVEVGSFRAVVNADGFAVAKDGGHPNRLVPTDDPRMSRTGWHWVCSWAGGKVSFPAPSSGAVNLADYIIAPPGNPVVEEWIGRIPELIDAAGSLVGIESVTSDDGDIVVTLSNGETHRFPMPPGTPGPPTDLTIGTVTVGEPASASISGAAPDQVLNLVLPPGQPGTPGDSAYQVAVAAGFLGTEAEWLASLKGEDGDTPALPPISWEDDQLRFGDLLSPPLTGPVSSLTIGTVTTGTASASITGTAPSQKLNLVLPPGTPGAPGAPGAVATSSTYLIVGPGRPDTSSTTGGTITGSEPVGAEYRSTDGANVGAWVWTKRPTGWVVVDGDTGWRAIPLPTTVASSGDINLKRVGSAVYAQLGAGAYSFVKGIINGGNAPSLVPPGFRPAKTVFATLRNDSGKALGSMFELQAQGTIVGRALTGMNGDQQGEISVYPAVGAWPTTLPGSPA